ncbi:hypothetical protein HYS96_03785 [Candidatus Daviesbacteria bacterium]|nr:hypothetical protein [Candidatus Daviesbacteria bacterium]
MIEILPVRLLTDEDKQLFGSLAVSLGKLKRAGLSVASGIVVTPPELKLKTVLEHYDFGTKEIFEQSLTLVKKELKETPLPEILIKEADKHRSLLLDGKVLKSVKELWQQLLDNWIGDVKRRLWKDGFYKGITENLDPKIVIFLKKLEALGSGYFDFLQDDTVINVTTGKLHPNDFKKIDELIRKANKKLFIPNQYEWIVDNGVKLVGLKQYTPPNVISEGARRPVESQNEQSKSAVKVFLDLSKSMASAENVDGVYIASEKIFDLNKPNESFEDLVLKLVETASSFREAPILFKLADKSEGMGKVRGSLRLLHQKTLFDPLLEALDFARHKHSLRLQDGSLKKGLSNIHIVAPFVRGVNELLQIKRELAVKKMTRKHSLQIWLEVAVPENIVNLEDYLVVGIDGVVINLDELIAHLNGFDPREEELMFYKNEVSGLLKFIEDGLKLLHKSKIPFIAYGSLSLYPKVLEFLVEKGVYGVVVERYEAHSIKDLLHQTERRMVLGRST